MKDKINNKILSLNYKLTDLVFDQLDTHLNTMAQIMALSNEQSNLNAKTNIGNSIHQVQHEQKLDIQDCRRNQQFNGQNRAAPLTSSQIDTSRRHVIVQDGQQYAFHLHRGHNNDAKIIPTYQQALNPNIQSATSNHFFKQKEPPAATKITNINQSSNDRHALHIIAYNCKNFKTSCEAINELSKEN
ncbi:unnamed protein product [Mytilus coruscus]|uniref:Uncharacterized protein n=1 Tax=Mytilus coruscus TaxID=42192 RepID=A0A6J8ACU3_MYTCO|nr:unnamed protein product [Mytilus coruscus]